MTTPSRPNIILIMADQMAAHALSLYGNTVCKTPNLERLAAQGTVFENGYSNNPPLRTQPCLNAKRNAIA